MNYAESEFNEKVSRVRRLMAGKGWEWVALSGVDSLAWVTGGARCFVDPGSQAGIATLLLGADRAILVTDKVEVYRLRDEELGSLPLEYSVQDWTDWYSRRAGVLKGLIGAERGVSDIPLSGWESGELELQPLRFSLTEPERGRFRKLAREAAAALEKVAREVRRGTAESQIAANVEAELAAREHTVAGDARRRGRARLQLPASASHGEEGRQIRHGRQFGDCATAFTYR